MPVGAAPSSAAVASRTWNVVKSSLATAIAVGLDVIDYKEKIFLRMLACISVL